MALNWKKKYALSFLIIVLAQTLLHAQPSGLKFNGHDVPLDQRTSLDLSPYRPIKAGSGFELSFDLKFEKNASSYFGYIFRAIVDGENYDFIFSPQSAGNNNLHLVINENISNISFYVPLGRLTADWNHVVFTLDGDRKTVELDFNGDVMEDQIDHLLKRAKLRLLFGAHRYDRFNSTDLPTMYLKQIKIQRDGKTVHYWPLDQSDGEVIEDLKSSRKAKVINPEWVIALHSTWQEKLSLKFNGRIHQVYDRLSNSLTIFSKDTIFTLDCSTGLFTNSKKNNIFPSRSDVQVAINQDNGVKFVYSIDNNFKYLLSDTLDLKAEVPGNNRLTKFWHHNYFLDPESNQLYAFGGYGQRKYLNTVLRFNETKESWDTLDYSGIFYPRYLAGLAYNIKDKNIYIIGGYGSKNGMQEINPGYYYEMLSYSPLENKFTQVAKFDPAIGAFCFSNKLYMDTLSNILYGLKYSKYEAKQKLQAVAISLNDYSLKQLGDAFDFNFLDVNSTIDLYYNQFDEKLIAVNTYFEKSVSDLFIHEISYPPIESESVDSASIKSGIRNFLLLTGMLLVIVFAFLIYLRIRSSHKNIWNRNSSLARDRKNESDNKEVSTGENKDSFKPRSIQIFGGFQVIDRSGKDITGLFTPLLKEIFLYIMLSSVRQNKGISSQKLNEVFWFDKSEQSARNNRAVNIAKLRSLLEQVGECQITKETGYWKFSFNPADIYIDYYHFLQLVRNNNKWNRKVLLEILEIVQAGSALSNFDADWLDDFKADISNDIIDGILSFIQADEAAKDPELIIQLSNCIFKFDTANEEAMTIKCKTLASLGKHSLAKNAYEKFEKEYEILYGEKFKVTFSEILGEES